MKISYVYIYFLSNIAFFFELLNVISSNGGSVLISSSIDYKYVLVYGKEVLIGGSS